MILLTMRVHHIYLCELNVSLNSLKIQKEELSEIKLVTIDFFKTELHKIDFEKVYVPHSQEYYNFILKNINLQLNK